MEKKEEKEYVKKIAKELGFSVDESKVTTTVYISTSFEELEKALKDLRM